MRWFVLAVALVGCSGEPSFELDKNRSCPVDFVAWDGGLTLSLTMGDGSGTFDYDPPGFESRLAGSYDLQTGDFGWETSYPAAHWRTSSEVQGFGYAAPNGDLDLEGSVTTTDVLDDEVEIEFRIERVGCEVTERAREPDGTMLTVLEGTYVAEGLQYTRVHPNAEWADSPVYEGIRRPDQTFTETVEVDEDGWHYESEENGDGEGYSRTDWAQSQDYDIEGYDEQFIDGRYHRYYDYSGPDGDYSWDMEVDYEGDGEGIYDAGDYQCDLTYEDWICTYDCGGGSTGDC